MAGKYDASGQALDGRGESAVFQSPRGMWLNSTSGILFVCGMLFFFPNPLPFLLISFGFADTTNGVVRQITPMGDVETLDIAYLWV